MNERSSMIDEAGLLREHWYAAARSSQVTSKAPLGRTIMDVDLVLWRTRAGKVVCTTDRCLHRNALLSEGDLLDDAIGCPYHVWTYDASGQCVHIPSAGPNSRVTCKPYRLRAFIAQERDGLVWVWLGAGEPSREPFRMPHWNAPGYRAYYMETMFDNEVTNLVENFMDVPHTVFVHKTWFRSRSNEKVRAAVERTEDSVLVTYDRPNDSIGVSGSILNPKGLPMIHTDKFYMPNNTRVDYLFGDRAFVITSTCTPIHPFRTRVFTLISYKLGWLNAIAWPVLPAYTRKVIGQDIEIMAIQGRSLRRAGADFHSTPADLPHTDIEALRDWALGGGAGPRPEPRTEQMEFWI